MGPIAPSEALRAHAGDPAAVGVVLTQPSWSSTAADSPCTDGEAETQLRQLALGQDSGERPTQARLRFHLTPQPKPGVCRGLTSAGSCCLGMSHWSDLARGRQGPCGLSVPGLPRSPRSVSETLWFPEWTTQGCTLDPLSTAPRAVPWAGGGCRSGPLLDRREVLGKTDKGLD